MRVYVYVILSALLGLPAFAPIERELERKIKAMTAGLDGIRVRIEATRLGFLFSGFCDRVEVELHGIKLGGLRTENFKVNAEALLFRPWSTFVKGKTIVRGAGAVKWSLRILAEDLETFIRVKGHGLAGITVSIDDTGITLHRPAGIARLFSLKETFTVRGMLHVKGKNADVCLDVDHFSAFGFAPGRRIMNVILNIINPIVKSADINSLMQKNKIEMLENVTPSTSFDSIVLGAGAADIFGAVTLETDLPPKTEPKESSTAVSK